MLSFLQEGKLEVKMWSLGSVERRDLNVELVNLGSVERRDLNVELDYVMLRVRYASMQVQQEEYA